MNKVYSPNNGNKKAQKSGENQRQTGPISDADKKRHTVMKGKCYRCGSGDHMANNCSVAKDVKCGSCNSMGHVAAACTPTASVIAVEGDSGQGNTLALEYQPEKQQQQQQQQLQQKAQVNHHQSCANLRSEQTCLVYSSWLL